MRRMIGGGHGMALASGLSGIHIAGVCSVICMAIASTALSCVVWAAQPGADDHEEVLRLERAQAEAVVNSDLDALNRIYADDFRFTHGTGEVQNKAEWLDDLRQGRRHYASRDHEELEVEIHAEIAVTYGRLMIRRRMDGVDSFFGARYVRVYGRRDDRWQRHRTVEQWEVQ